MAARTFSTLSLSRRLGVAATSSLLVAAVLTSFPIESAVAADDEFEQPKSVGNKNDSKGSASELGVALAKARESKKPVTATSLATSTETFVANPDGTVTREIAQSPIRAKDDEGDLVPIDTGLAEDNGRLVPEATTGDVSFSVDGEGASATYEPGKGKKVSLSFNGPLGEPEVEGSIATYPVTGDPNQAVQVYARNNGFASRVLLAAPPAVSAQEATTTPDAEENDGAASEDPGSAESTDEPGAGQVAAEPAEPQPSEGPTTLAPEGPEQGPEDVVLRFDLDVQGLVPALKDGVLTLSGTDGKVAAQSNPLEMWDSRLDVSGDPAEKLPVDAELERSDDGGYVLVLRPAMEFLTSADTVYPVFVDPDIMGVANGDTYYYSDQPSSLLRGQEPILRVGSDDGDRMFRSLLQWNYRTFLGTTVTKADLRLYQYYTGSATCGNTTMNLFPTLETSVNTWWGNKPAVTASSRFKSSKSFSNGGTGCPKAFETIDVTPMVNAWASGHSDFYDPNPANTRGRQGMELRANDELNPGFRKHFCSENPDPAATGSGCTTSSRVPTLAITYAPEVGTQSWYSMTDHTLNDRSSISVNNKNGNAVASASDVNVNGLGVDLSIDRTYNSQSPEVSSVGRGWSLGVGPDVWLEKKSTYRYDFHAPGGTLLGSFIRKSATSTDADFNKFETPTGGARADLTQSGTTFTLKFRGNRTSYEFMDNAPDDHAYLTLLKDRSGNNVEVNYSGSTSAGRPKMTSIAGSGQTLNVTYGSGSAADYVTKIDQTFANAGGSGTTSRNWEYDYNGAGYLTSYTDALDNTTTYGYADVTGPVDVLDTITAPVNDSGRAPTTKIAYAYDGGLEINQVAKVSYRYGTGDNDFYDYTYVYRTGDAQRPSRCDGNGNYFTIVTDANDHDTTYCYRSRTDAGGGNKTWVYDGLGNARSIDFTADNGPVNVTDPSGQGVTNGSTVAKYSTNLPDQLESTTEPKSAADDRATTAFAYGSASSNGGSYQPTATKDPAGNCNRYGYDSAGRTTDAYTGISVTGSTSSQLQSAGSCGPNSGSGVKRFHRDYNSNGTVSASWDANAGSGTPATADQTIYAYWTGGDPGYVAGTAGQVKSIRKPGGDCSATVAAGRSLCTSYTYDGAARVASITNGNGVTTTYTRDLMDRTKEAFFDGASSCDLISFANCLRYAYDAEGNLVSRLESLLESTTFDYDQLNRQVQISSTTDTLQPSDVVGSAYDGTGNITTYTQSVNNVADTVTYGYNAANRLEAVTDATGTIDLTTDQDGRTESMTFPKPGGADGMKIDYDFTETGKPKSLDIEKHSGSSIAGFDYSYVVDPFAGTPYAGIVEVETSQMRNREVTGSLSGINIDVDYTYDKDNRLTGANAVSGTDYSYEYDGVGNITKEEGTSTTHYGYNRAGELCWEGPNTGTKIDRLCPSTPSGNTTLTRDKAGNNTGTSSAPVAYNAREQVSTIGGTDMKYRDLGNDLRSVTGATRTTSGPIGITATRTGSDVTFYTRDPNGTILNSHSGTTVRNHVTEYNSSVVALFNPAGTAVGSYKYAPYGATAVNAESGGATADNNRFRYISGYQDLNSSGGDGYYKLGARYYDARGHFTQPDAIAGSINNPKTLTAYNYAGGDPINQADPSGNAFFDANVSLCALACLTLGIGTDGDFDPSIGFGVGPDIGVVGSAGPGFGSNEGSEVSAQCSAGIGPVGAFIEAGLSGPNDFSGGSGVAFGAGGGCTANYTYTF